ncbi:hypothetical protein PTTG_11661 [Puccinia triticina 1-1 BBBD Race 1]|uniref:Uncharacterized protein n=1 Tax=Puccinia triticina (isolate 1-1 / race 1 (BBBD)) TaxID=630390 RepID=A0A180G4R8_PUCT1|nr:hypothetical protein PTTG_11661 [Puccinia triticina 1-1 BBBD Race 1]
MDRVAPTWLEIILCSLSLVTTAFPAELQGLRTTARDPINPRNNNPDVFEGLDCDFLGPSELQSITEELKFPNYPYYGPLGHPVPALFRPSEEIDGHHPTHDQAAILYYKEGVAPKRRLIQAPAKPVAFSKGSEPVQGPKPHRIKRLAMRGIEEEIKRLISGTVWQAGTHDRKLVSLRKTLQDAQRRQPLIHQSDNPLQTEAPSESFQTSLEAVPCASKQVRPNERLEFDDQQTTIEHVTQTSTIPELHPQSSIARSNSADQAKNKQPNQGTRAEKTELLSRGPQMDALHYRVLKALSYQDRQGKEEFRLFKEKLLKKHYEIDDLYRSSPISPSTEINTEMLGELEMIVDRIGLPEKHGEHYLWDSLIRPPLQSKNQQVKKYDLILNEDQQNFRSPTFLS